MIYEKQIIIPPKNGWKPKTYYVVEISMNIHNPVFMDIFYSGFLNDGRPCGYNELIRINKEITDVKYLRVISKIDSYIPNNGKMLKKTIPEYFLV